MNNKTPGVIKEIYAFVSCDDGGEGVCAFNANNGWLPLIGADMDRVTSLKEIAQKIANETGQNITLAIFDNRQDIETIKPEV